MDFLKKSVSKTLLVLALCIAGIVLTSPAKATLITAICSMYILKESINKLAKAWANKLEG